MSDEHEAFVRAREAHQKAEAAFDKAFDKVAWFATQSRPVDADGHFYISEAERKAGERKARTAEVLVKARVRLRDAALAWAESEIA